MSLNTNGWDYIYTINIKSLNTIIQNNSNLNSFFKTKIDFTNDFSDSGGTATIGNKDVIKITDITEFKISEQSSYNLLKISMIFSGTFNTNSFTGLKATVFINIDWLNKNQKSVSIPTQLNDINLVIDTNATFTPSITPSELERFNALFKFYFNQTNIDSGLTINNTVQHNYDNFYKAFASLNTFSSQSGCAWMIPSVQRFNAKINVNAPPLDTNTFFSFSCMIGSNTNNDIGYVDLNAIPSGASSALVIERGVFGEHMVKAAFAKDNKLFDKAATVLDKSGAYSFSNNNEVSLKSKDYKDEKKEAVSGTVAPERLLVSVEESNIKLSMGDVEYTYNENNWTKLKGENKPTINQEYVFNLEWESGKIKAKAKEKLFIISNTFSPNTKWDLLFNIGTPLLKNFLFEPAVSSIIEKSKGIELASFIKIDAKIDIPSPVTAPQPQPQRQFFNRRRHVGNNRVAPKPPILLSRVQNELNDSNNISLDNNDNSRYQLNQNPEIRPLSDRDKKKSIDIVGDRPQIAQNGARHVEVEMTNINGSVKDYYLTKFFKEVDEKLNKCKVILPEMGNIVEKYLKGNLGHEYKNYEEEVVRLKQYTIFLNSIIDTSKKLNLNSEEFIIVYENLLNDNKAKPEIETNNEWYLFNTTENNWINKIKRESVLKVSLNDVRDYFNENKNKMPFKIVVKDGLYEKTDLNLNFSSIKNCLSRCENLISNLNLKK